MRGPRFIPPGWSVEITTNTVCDFFLLPATSYFARIFVGILARAQEKHPVRVHAAVAASSHYLCAAAHKKWLEAQVTACKRTG